MDSNVSLAYRQDSRRKPMGWVPLTGPVSSGAGSQGLALDELVVVVGRGAFTLGPVSLALASTGVVGLLGQNGAGKTTLMRSLAQLDRVASGEIAIGDRSIETTSDRRWARGVVGFVPQSAALPALPTCEDFLHYAAYLRGVGRDQRRGAVDSALRAVDLDDRRRSRLRSLSGGMARRLLIAQALVHRPRVLLLDEPTAGLDPAQRAKLKQLLAVLANETLIVMATHLVEDVASLARRVVVLRRGAVVFDDSAPAFAAVGGDSSSQQSGLEAAFARLTEAEDTDGQ